MSLLKKFVKLTKTYTNFKLESNKWFNSNLSKPNAEFQKVSHNYIRLGGFYFLKYDLSNINKSSKIEQYSIAFIVDYKPKIDNKVFWAINFNFLPSDVRRNFFLHLIDNKYDYIIDDNEKRDSWINESPISNISYKKVMEELARFGIVYTKCIRTYRIDLINEIYGLSTKNLEKIISLDVKPISGMDDIGITKVLYGKLKNEGVESILQDIEIVQDYEKILEDLKERYKNIEKYIEGS